LLENHIFHVIKHLKKLFAISLFFLMLYNLLGYMVHFHMVKKEWRAYVHKTLSKLSTPDEIITFHFAKNEFDISENEFQKNGHFYDVVKYEMLGDSIKVYCFDDKTETQLVAQYHTILQENTEQNADFQGKTAILLKLIVKEYLFESPLSLKAPPSVFKGILAVFYNKKSCFVPPFLDTESLPPQGI
jgi:hypothetical protein